MAVTALLRNASFGGWTGPTRRQNPSPNLRRNLLPPCPRGRSSRPATPSASYRFSHSRSTGGRDPPANAAISFFCRPSAHHNTIRARVATGGRCVRVVRQSSPLFPRNGRLRGGPTTRPGEIPRRVRGHTTSLANPHERDTRPGLQPAGAGRIDGSREPIWAVGRSPTGRTGPDHRDPARPHAAVRAAGYCCRHSRPGVPEFATLTRPATAGTRDRRPGSSWRCVDAARPEKAGPRPCSVSAPSGPTPTSTNRLLPG